jgi:O-antigen/teichoic acid export membrane protein
LKTATPRYETREWLRSLLPLSLFSGLRKLDTQLALLILGVMASAEDVGHFRVAAQGALTVAFGLTVVNLVVSPHIVRLHRRGERERLQRMITFSTRLVTAVALPAFLLLCFWGAPILSWVFGAEYAAAAPALAIMCFGQLLNSACGSVGLVLNLTGHEQEALKGVVVAVCLSAVLSLVLVPFMGITGAAIAYTTSFAVWNFLLVILTRRKTGLHTFVLPLPRLSHWTGAKRAAFTVAGEAP